MAGKVVFLCLTVLCMPILSNAENVDAVSCTSNDQCTVTNSVCDTAAGTCKCDESTGYTKNPDDGTACIKVLGLDCSGDAAVCDVIQNTACPSGTCACATNYYESSNLCVKVLDRACTADNANTVCTVQNSECKSLQCKCKAGYTEDNAACTKVLDRACTAENANTVCTVENSECRNSQCKCMMGYMEKNDVCTKVLGADCSTDSNVCNNVANSECASNSCACSANYEMADDVCKKVAGQTCTANDECSSNKCEGETGSMTCAEKNSAHTVMLSAGMVAVTLLATLFLQFF